LIGLSGYSAKAADTAIQKPKQVFSEKLNIFIITVIATSLNSNTGCQLPSKLVSVSPK
jgi:hypothetical protein